MKITSNGYAGSGNITSLLVPETDVEETLLKALWKHGRMEYLYTGYAITQGRWQEPKPTDKLI